jgi:hypothetical protein
MFLPDAGTVWTRLSCLHFSIAISAPLFKPNLRLVSSLFGARCLPGYHSRVMSPRKDPSLNSTVRGRFAREGVAAGRGIQRGASATPFVRGPGHCLNFRGGTDIWCASRLIVGGGLYADGGNILESSWTGGRWYRGVENGGVMNAGCR